MKKDSMAIVAEIGLNFNGDMGLAKKAILKAKECGATSTKFQYYKTEDFICDTTILYEYVSQGKKITESQYDMFKRCELSKKNMSELILYGSEIGIDVFATPTSVEGVQELCDMGVKILKNGSDYLTHIPIIEKMARTDVMTVLSTGMGMEEDIDDAVNAYFSSGGQKLILLHCTSLYPTPLEKANICRMNTLQSRYGSKVQVGFSDHTQLTLPVQMAVALDAVYVEKHFTLDKNLPGPDHRFSSDPSEFRQYVEAIKIAQAVFGNGVMSVEEKNNRKNFALSCVVSRDLLRGHCLTMEDLVFARPGTGIRPKFASQVCGHKITQDMKKGDVLTWQILM